MDEASPRPTDLPDDPAALKALVREQAFEIERLKEELRLAAHKRFGASSEKADPDQGQLFNEAEVLSAVPPAPEADGRVRLAHAENNDEATFDLRAKKEEEAPPGDLVSAWQEGCR